MSEELFCVLKMCGRCRNLLLEVCAFYDYVEHISYAKSLLSMPILSLLVQLKHILLLSFFFSILELSPMSFFQTFFPSLLSIFLSTLAMFSFSSVIFLGVNPLLHYIFSLYFFKCSFRCV